MTDSCCAPDSGFLSEKTPALKSQKTYQAVSLCPVCGMRGKAVQGQTVKAMLLVSLREVHDDYLFCRTRTCQVVYFSPDGDQTFTVDQVRERVYQKDPESDEVCACYCFHHTYGDLRLASAKSRAAMVEDIQAGINAGQCACDLRNPQGSCCLGNVLKLINQLDASSTVTPAVE